MSDHPRLVFSEPRAFMGSTPSLGERVFVAPGVQLLGDVTLGDEVSLWYNAVLRGDVMPIRIGARTNIQDLAMLHATTGVSPTIVGEDVTVGHHAILHGCTIGDGCLIGMGAVVLDGAHVPDGCLVGAGALVTPGSTFPEHSMILGSPARVKRALSAEEVANLRLGAAHYVENALRHAESLGS